MKIKLSLIIFSFFSSYIYAIGATTKAKIERMYVNNNWTMVYAPGAKLDAGEENANCPAHGYYAIVPEHKNYEVLHGTLLAAQMASKTVMFYVSGCSGQNNNSPRITSIWIDS